MANNHIRNYALEMLRDLIVITIRKEYLPDRKALHPDEKLLEKYPESEEFHKDLSGVHQQRLRLFLSVDLIQA